MLDPLAQQEEAKKLNRIFALWILGGVIGFLLLATIAGFIIANALHVVDSNVVLAPIRFMGYFLSITLGVVLVIAALSYLAFRKRKYRPLAALAIVLLGIYWLICSLFVVKFIKASERATATVTKQEAQ